MGLYDRDYMREDDQPVYHRMRSRPWSAVTWLLVLNAAAFLVQSVIYGYPPNFRFGPPLALRAEELLHGYVWQLLTYQLLHGGLLHLLLNCLGIFMFGREVEAGLGRKRFFLLYFACGVVGGVLQALCAFGWPGRFGGAVVGASAGVFGLVAAFATMFPHRVITLLLFFILPVSLKARTMILISGAIAVFGILFPADNIAHAAHLGGMLAGMVFIRQWRFRWGYWPGEQMPPAKVAPPPIINARPDDTDDFIAAEVDPILEKIATHGIHSLTERERKILETARKRMNGK
jgi:membrane associated rhomboid family serine protease